VASRKVLPGGFVRLCYDCPEGLPLTSHPPLEPSKKDEKGDSEPPVPVGSLNSFANIYWNKDDDTWTSKEPEDTKPAEGKDTIGHAIVIRQQKSSDSRKKYEIHSIVVQSPALKVALGEILEDYPGVCCNLDRLVFKAPFQPFVHRWGALVEYMEKDDLETTTKEYVTPGYKVPEGEALPRWHFARHCQQASFSSVLPCLRTFH
jgi:hypothetical protein